MKQMVELTKYLKFLVVGSLLIILSCTSENDQTVNDSIIDSAILNKKSLPMTKEDSILQLADELKITYNLNEDNINDVLNKILVNKKFLLKKLDSLDKRASELEYAAISYKKKENEEIKRQLLSEIDRIKAELERIKSLAGSDVSDEIVIREENSIPEIKVPDIATSFENLPVGNYLVRLDKYYILSVYVSPKSEIIVGSPKLDSTTVIRGDAELDSRIAKELKQIKERFKNK